MGFNKRYLPSLEELLERRKEYGSDLDFFNAVVGKSDALMGPSDSMKYIDSIYKNIRKKNDRESKYT